MLFVKAVLKIVLPVLIIGGAALAFIQRQAIFDWWQLHNYTPSKAVAALASQDTMSDEAKHIFYVNHPALIANKSQFQKACTQTEQTIVLGCYKSADNGIEIYAVSEKKLSGIQQVTAAHEMLHAAYERLDSNTRNQVNAWLQDYYKHDLKDPRIIKTMASYKKTEPNDVVNEMHSVFGTEIRHLPPNLENYYKRYFSNRAKIVDFSDRYETAFTTVEDKASNLYAQLKALLTQINNLQISLNNQKAAIDADRSSIQTQAQANAFNARVRSYNAQINYFNSLVAQYNSIRNQYNNLVLQQQQLFNAIDTRSVQTSPAQ